MAVLFGNNQRRFLPNIKTWHFQLHLIARFVSHGEANRNLVWKLMSTPLLVFISVFPKSLMMGHRMKLTIRFRWNENYRVVAHSLLLGGAAVLWFSFVFKVGTEAFEVSASRCTGARLLNTKKGAKWTTFRYSSDLLCLSWLVPYIWPESI